MKQSIIALVICAIKILIMGNSVKETFSNFWKQKLANHLLFLNSCFINKLTEWEWQWVLHSVPPLQMHFYVVTKNNGWINCPIHFKPVMYKRYVDDTFVLFSSKEHLQLFVDYMKKQHKCLKSTFETENDNSVSFLDIKVTRHNHQFKTFVYRKPTSSGVFKHYQSYVDQTYKKSLIDTLLFRCFSIYSDYTSFHLEVENLREVFKKNGYPSRIIEQSIRSFLNKLHVPKKVILTVSKRELFILLPYLGTLSYNFKQKLRTCFKNALPQCNIKIILKSTNRLSSLSRFKDVIPKEL